MKHHPLRLLLVAASASLALGQNNGIALTNGVDGFLEIPYAPAAVPQAGITFEAWLTYSDTTLGTGYRYPTVVRQNIAPGQESYFLRVNANNTGARVLRWKVVSAAGGQFFADWTFASGQLTTWTHVAGTWDGLNARLFVNGVQVAMSAASATPQPVWDRGGVLRIGKGDDSGGPIEVWNGELDEVRLWPFARSAAEIQQTMNFQLHSVPGLVSTWNLDTNTSDSSGSLSANVTGTITFTPNPLALTLLAAPSAFAVGTSTAGCAPLRMTFGSLPQAGNAAFAPVCTRAPANATTFLAIAFGTNAAPLPIFGIDYWLDLGSSSVFLANTGALGKASQTIAIPPFIQPGQAFAFQYGFVDPCGSQGFSASDALVTITQ